MHVSSPLRGAAHVLVGVLAHSDTWQPPDWATPAEVLQVLRKNRISLSFIQDQSPSAMAWLAQAPACAQVLAEERCRLALARGYFDEAIAAFKQQGLEAILIKSVGFFPPETSNIDLLVRWDALDAAKASLQRLGYLEQRSYQRPDKFLYAKFLGGEKVSLIHLHARVSWGPPFLDERLIWKRHQVAVDGTLRPAPEHACMITIAHNFYEDSEFDLWDLTKLRLCNPSELDWDEIFTEARRWGWDNGLSLSLLLLNRAHVYLFKGRNLVPTEVLRLAEAGLKESDGTRSYWRRSIRRGSIEMPLVIPKVFTKAHAFLTSVRSQPTPWRLKMRDMGLLARWASETLLGIRVRHSFLVTFSGADGSGKTTLANALERALVATGEEPQRVWLRAGDSPLLQPLKTLARPYMRTVNSERVETKSGGTLTNPRWRSLWLWLTTLDLLIRYTAVIRFQLWRKRFVICDRHIADTLVDISYRSTWDLVRQSRMVRFLMRIAPCPDVAYLCGSPAHVLAARRVEDLSLQEAQQLEEWYRTVQDFLPGLVMLDTTKPEVDTATLVVYKVLAEYHERY